MDQKLGYRCTVLEQVVNAFHRHVCTRKSQSDEMQRCVDVIAIVDKSCSHGGEVSTRIPFCSASCRLIFEWKERQTMDTLLINLNVGPRRFSGLFRRAAVNQERGGANVAFL